MAYDPLEREWNRDIKRKYDHQKAQLQIPIISNNSSMNNSTNTNNSNSNSGSSKHLRFLDSQRKRKSCLNLSQKTYGRFRYMCI